MAARIGGKTDDRSASVQRARDRIVTPVGPVILIGAIKRQQQHGVCASVVKRPFVATFSLVPEGANFHNLLGERDDLGEARESKSRLSVAGFVNGETHLSGRSAAAADDRAGAKLPSIDIDFDEICARKRAQRRFGVKGRG